MIIRLFIFWRLSLFFLTYLGSFAFELKPNRGIGAIDVNKPFDYWASWAQWDGGHYLLIAQNGFGQMSEYAFFPLYPLLVNLFEKLTHNFLFSGLLASNILFLLFLLIFHKFIKKHFSKKIADTSIITFLFFPTSFFATAFYSEALFLFTTILAFYFLYEKKYSYSSIFIIFSSLTRAVGALLVISSLFRYLKYEKVKLNTLLVQLSSGAGILFYCLYLYIKTGDALAFISAQIYWERSITNPLTTIFNSIADLLLAKPIINYLDLILTFFFLTLIVIGRKKIPSSLWIFSLLVILIPIATGTFTSMPRYLLSSLGSFIILGSILENRKILTIAVWTTFLLLQVFLAVRFVNGYWAS